MFGQINDVEFRRLILGYLEDIADEESDASDNTDLAVELLDRAGLTVCASVTAGAIGAIIASAAALAPILLLGMAAGGMAVCGIGRTAMKRRGLKRKANARKIRQLADRLRTIET
jgi:hypothetical protein